MKTRKSLLFYLVLISITFAFILSVSVIFGQTYVPITNNHNGISIGIQGTQGTDYIFDRYYFDPLINDIGLCYIKSDAKITLAHNQYNSRIDEMATVIVGGEEGDIRYKVDKDWQKNYWAGGYSNIYPLYTGPVSFEQMSYEPGVPVVGTIGMKPGVSLTDRINSYSRGMLDAAGNEYHYFTYADDDDHDPNGGFQLEKCASDGKSMLFCVNPKTPAIWLAAASASAQYYTTPAKIYWVPRIYEQTSYVTDNVNIQLKNIMNSNTVYYRIDGGSYQAYTGPISSNNLSDGIHTLEFYYNSSYVQTRKIVKNPDHPSKQDVFADGTGHGYLLWKNDAEFVRFKDRMLTGIFTNNTYMSNMTYSNYKTNYLIPDLGYTGNNGIRNQGKDHALMYAMVGILEGIPSNMNYMDAAKIRVLNNKRMHIENVGWETEHDADPNPSHELTYRGYYDDHNLYNMAFAYDLLAKYYRSDQYAGGITPIEDYRIRDMLAITINESFLWFGGYRMAQSPDVNPGPQVEMWSTAHQNAALMAALAMPSYSSNYYGTSGFDGTPATFTGTPYPDMAVSWKDLFVDKTDKDNSQVVSALQPFPNQCQLFNWFDGSATEGLIRSNGDWLEKYGYCIAGTMGHGIEIFYNVLKKKFNKTYPALDLFMQKSTNGTLYCVKPDYFIAVPRRNMANEYFPDLAPLVVTQNDGDNKYFYDSRPYYFFFHNPDYANVTLCESTSPPSIPTNLDGTTTEASVSLTWSPSTHSECSVLGYKIKRNGIELSTTTNNFFVDANLDASTQYTYSVASISEANVVSNYCTSIQLTTQSVIAAPNVALNKTVTVSSAPQAEYPAAYLTNGDVSDMGRWSADTYPEWAEIDLGANYDILKFDLYPFEGRAYQYIIEAKADGGNYTTVVDRNSNSENNTVLSDYASTTARYVKITVSGASGYTGTWISLNELKVYGNASSGNIPVSGISVSPATVNLSTGQTSDLTETVSPSNATNKLVTWSSSNTSVATVNASGLVTAVSAGTATITVTTNDGAYTATCIVSISTGSQTTNLALNKPVVASSVNTYAAANAVDGNSATRWSSNFSEPEWIYVDLGETSTINEIALQWETAYGSAYEIQVSDDASTWNTIYSTTSGDGGTDQIVGLAASGRYVRMYGSARGTSWGFSLWEFEVFGSAGSSTTPVSDVSVSPNTLTLDEGQSSYLTETVSPVDATDKSVSWSSSNTSVATVNASGLVSAVSTGTATITVTTNDGNHTATCNVTVNSIVTNLALNKPITVSAYQDDSYGYKPGINLVDGDVSDDARWSAPGFPQWAEIDLGANCDLSRIDVYPFENRMYQYIVEAKTASGSYITIVDRSTNTEGFDVVSDNVNCTARYIKITVFSLTGVTSTWVSLSELEIYGVESSLVSVTGVTLNTSMLSLDAGQASDLNETVSPANATDPSVSWSSSNTSVATVNSSGLVTAISEGSATIIVTTNDGSYSANCAVTVNAVVISTRTVIIESNCYDQQVNSNNTLTWNGQATHRVGGAGTGIDANSVHPFALPALAYNEEVVSARFTATLKKIATSPQGNVDLYGLPFRTSSSVSLNDYYQGAYGSDANNYPIMNDFVTLTTPLGAVSNNASSEAVLAGFVNNQYNAGAQSGDFVFLRLNPDVSDVSNYNYWEFHSANAADAANRPVLELEISSVPSKSKNADIKQISGKNDLSVEVYPNPLIKSTMLTINIGGCVFNETFQIQLFDITGRIVYSSVSMQAESNGVRSISLSTDELANKGLYIISVKTKTKCTQHKIVVR